MSTRKPSLKIDRTTLDIRQVRNTPFQHSRQRKNSLGGLKPTLQQLHQNINITLDEKLTVKLIFTKKLEKLEKEAIRYFYQHKIEECFGCLEKCLNMLEDRGVLGTNDENSYPEHVVYVRYLQSQFKYKLKQYGQAREFYQKAIKTISKLNKQLPIYHRSQRQKTKQYIINLQALNACLQYQQSKYPQCIKNVQQIQTKINQGRIRLSEKIVKQLSLCRIQSLLYLNQYQLVIKLVEKFMGEWRNVTMRERFKVQSILASSYWQIGATEQSQQIMQGLIEYYKNQAQINHQSGQVPHPQQTPSTQSQQYLSKSYSTYIDLLTQNPIKSIYLCRKWQESCSYPDESIIKLFHLYYKIGDYEEALVQYAQLSENYKRTSQDWLVLAEIKEFYGEDQTAQHMLVKGLELAKGDEQRMLIQVKLLRFTEESGSNSGSGGNTRKQSMRNFQKRIKQHRHKQWIQKIVQIYGEYLEYIGQPQRLQKLTKIISSSISNHQTPKQPTHTHTHTHNNNPHNPSFSYITNNNSNQHPDLVKNIDEFMQTGKFGSVSSIKKDSYYRDYQNYQYQNQNQDQRGEGRSSKRGSGVIERML